MTKIKNTKKGMAKKTLSMSLVVAMLATSNVPVWAAEFSDGSDVAVTSEAAAPVAEDTEAFSDETVDAPVVDDAAEEVSTAQVADGYTVNTNMELKSNDWATGLTFAVKDGVTDAAKFEVLDKNTVPKKVTKIEIYSGTDMLNDKTVTFANGETNVTNIANALATKNVGLDAYKNSKQVTVKFYVEGENEAVFEQTATVKPVTLDNTWTVTSTTLSTTYNGTVQAPTVTVQKSGYADPASVLVKFDGEKEAKNVGKYKFSVEGVEADGYVGTIKNNSFEYTINSAPVIDPTTNEPNISIQVSGTASYNGQESKPTVVVTDKFTNTVISPELYDVSGEINVGDHKKVTVTLKANNNKTGNDLLTNNFEARVINPSNANDKKCYSGSYKIEALDLSKLADKYNVTIATKKVGESVNFEDITLTDKTTGKKVDTATVLGAFTKSTPTAPAATYNSLVTIVTSNNTATGNGKVIIRSTSASSTDVVNEFSANYTVVNATITPSDLSFPKGTKVGSTTLDRKTAFLAALSFKAGTTNQLNDETYTGSAIEPYKEAFSNLVLTNSATVTDQKLVLGTDYDIVYENNTNSKTVSGKSATVKLVFKGNYAGTISYSFDIKTAEAFVSGKDIEYTAGKKSYDVAAKVVTKTADGKEVAVPEKEYTVTTTKKATLGDRTAEGVVVFNNKNYTINNVTTKNDGYYYTNITSKVVAKNLKNCTATVEGTYVYTGESVSPKLVVKDGDTVLVEGTDYTVTSKTGTNAGPAHVTITGKAPNYTGTLTVDYTIAKANLANATIVSKASDGKNLDVTYTGYPVDFKTLALKSVKIGNAELDEYSPITKKGEYTVSWDADATEVGTYNFTITAVPGNTKVEGEYKGTFKIVPATIEAGFAPKLDAKYANRVVSTVLDSKTTGAYYTGKAITIDSFKTKYVVVDNSNKVLTEGKDYELRYTNNIEAGIATVEAYGIGNHKNINSSTKKEEAIATLKYNIDPTAVITSNMIQKISDVEYAGGLPVEPQVVILDAKGNRLTQGVDYTVEAVKNTTPITEIGSYTKDDVIIKGKGAYLTASATGTPDYSNTGIKATDKPDWKVTKKDLANTAVSVDKENNVTVLNGTVIVPATEYDVKFSDDKQKVTVTAKANSTKYTGSKEITLESAKVGQAMIANVVVKGNTVTPVLSSEVDEAVGYDYVIATEEDYKNGRVGVSKNILKTNTDFHYVQQGTYYAYCHAWKRNAEGKKVFGEWSNIVKFTVTATTPSTPTVKSVKVKGNTVTVTYTVSEDATGYDVVLGSAVKKVNGEKRPVDYGTLVKKNIKGNVVTATFKNVPAGKYYAGVHSFNKTSENGSKVFSKWSNSKAVTVK